MAVDQRRRHQPAAEVANRRRRAPAGPSPRAHPGDASVADRDAGVGRDRRGPAGAIVATVAPAIRTSGTVSPYALRGIFPRLTGPGPQAGVRHGHAPRPRRAAAGRLGARRAGDASTARGSPP